MNFFLFRGYIFHFIIFMIIGLLSFEFYIYLSISRDKRMAKEKKYVLDYESVLCSANVPNRTVQNKRERCPEEGIVTAFRHGGLAMSMWQYANVIAASISLGLDAYIPFCFQDSLGRIFSNISIPLLGEIGHCLISLPDSAKTIEEWRSGQQSIVIKSDELYNDVVIKYLDFIRTHFVFRRYYVEFVERFFAKAMRQLNKSNATFIGVYITKTSIIVNQEYDDVFPSVQFFVDAMNHFRMEFPNALFIVITDRKSFWEYIFGDRDVYITDEEWLEEYGSALAVLAHCNHTILASDDFPVWGAILAGGKTIVSLCVSEDFNGLMQSNKNWNYLMNNTKSVNKFLDRLF